MILQISSKIPEHQLVEEEVGFLTIVVVATAVFIVLLLARYLLRRKEK